MGPKKLIYEIILDSGDSIKNMADLIQQQKQLRKEILNATNVGTTEYEKLKDQYRENAVAIREFNRDLRGSGTLAQGVSKGMIDAFKKVGIAVAAAFSIGAVIDFGKSIGDLVSKIDDGFARVNTVAQLSTEELNKLRDSAIEIGTTGATALEEIPDALFDIVSGTGDTNLSLEILEQSIKATDAGFGELGSTAQAGVNILNAVGSEVISINEVFDILFATQKEGVVSFDQLSKILPNVIPSAEAVGFSFEETAAALATLTKQGLDAEASGNSLRAFFTTFTQQSKIESFQEQLQKVGSSVFDSSGELRDFNDIIKDFSNVLAQAASDEERSQIFQDLGFDQQSVKAIQGLVGGIEDLESVSGSIAVASDGVGELNRQLNLSENGTRTLGIAQNQLKAELFEFGERIVPSVEQAQAALLRTLAKLLAGLNDVIDFFQKNKAAGEALFQIIRGLSIIIGTRLIGTLIKATGASNLLSKAFLNLRNPMLLFRNGVSAIGKAISANPIGILITAVLTLRDVIPSLVKGFDAAAESQKRLEDSTSGLVSEIDKEVKQVGTLISAIGDTTLSTDERNAALKELNKTYGEYLPNIDFETASQQDLQKAYEQTTLAISRSIVERKKAQLQAESQDKVLELIAKRRIAQQQLNQLTLEARENLSSVGGATGELFNAFTGELLGESQLNTIRKRTNELKKIISDTSNEIKTNELTLKALDDSVEEFAKTVLQQNQLDSFSGIFKSQFDAESEARKAAELAAKKEAERQNADRIKAQNAFFKEKRRKEDEQFKEELQSLKDQSDKRLKIIELDFLKSKEILEKQLSNEDLSLSERISIQNRVSENEKIFRQKNRDEIIKSSDEQLSLIKEFGKEEVSTEEDFLLSKQKAQLEFTSFISKQRQNEIEEQKRIAEEQMSNELIRLENSVKTLENELLIFERSFAEKEIILRKAGVSELDIERQKNESKREIQEKFALDVINDAEKLQIATATLEFESGKKSLEDKERFEDQKLKASLTRAEAELQLLKKLGSEEEVRIKNLEASIASYRSQIDSVNENTTFNFSEIASKFQEGVGVFNDVFSKVQELLNLRTTTIINSLDKEITLLQEKSNNTNAELQALDAQILNTNASSRAALEAERRLVDERFQSEKKQISDLEKTKEEVERKAFVRNQNSSIATAIINGAVAITKSLGAGPFSAILAAATAASVAAQVAIIRSQKFELGGLIELEKFAEGGQVPKNGGMIVGPSHSNGGIKIRVKGERKVREVEGDEFIFSKRAVSYYGPSHLSKMNDIGNRLGSIVPHGIMTRSPRRAIYMDGGLIAKSTKSDLDELVNTSGEITNSRILDELSKLNDNIIKSRKVILSVREVRDALIDFQDNENLDD